FNAQMTEKAEAIRSRIYASVDNDKYDFLDKDRFKRDFLAYYKKQLSKHDPKWKFVYLHFCNYEKGKCTFEYITL
ncbi:site-specific integrase, partial [Bacteroides nordii]|nr:site-specific integrase [Bacteroides nordii]